MVDKIEHVIVLMLENRSFDHFLGDLPNVDGIDPNNPRINRERPNSNTVYKQQVGAARKMKPDPLHDTKNVLRQINGEGNLGQMGGFVYDFVSANPNASGSWQEVMSYFSVGTLPALHELSQNFCVCDSWFSSVPGPTWTNRFFVHSGTSQGWVEMPNLPFDLNLHKYDQTTIYDRMNERNISWRIYAGDIPHSLLLYNQRNGENLRNYHRLKTFFKDVNSTTAANVSTFPSYIFIEPHYLPYGQDDQHPPNDILKGDDLIASVYNVIRSNQAIWDSTLLIVLWDEHGGFYDHVYPPKAEPPDHKQEEYSFDQYGVRVPAVLISPWVSSGVFRPKVGTLDHTSILRFLMDKFGLGPLGERVAKAATFADAITQNVNPAAPMKVGIAPRSAAMLEVGDEIPAKLNENQVALIEFSKQLELELGASPAEVGTRTMRSTASLQGEIEVAKERVWEFIDKKSR